MTGCPSGCLGLRDFVGKGLESARTVTVSVCVCVRVRVYACALDTFSTLATGLCPLRTSYQGSLFAPTGLCPDSSIETSPKALEGTGPTPWGSPHSWQIQIT